MRVAATAIREYRRPVGLLVWGGRHAWVMSGFEATGDPLLAKEYRVTKAYILDPLYPYGDDVWGPSPKPGHGDLGRGGRTPVHPPRPAPRQPLEPAARRRSASPASGCSSSRRAGSDPGSNSRARRSPPMPSFTKSSPELVARFDEVAARHPAAQRRKMFGYPALFVGGNFATGLFEESWVVRLADADLDGAARDAGRGHVLPDARQGDEGLGPLPASRRGRRRARPVAGACLRLRREPPAKA